MMNRKIRHLEHHFHVNGRLFVVHVFNRDPAPTKLFRALSTGKAGIDVSIYSYQPADEGVDPETMGAMAPLIVGRIKSCLPSTVSSAQWIQFENAVSDWLSNDPRDRFRIVQDGWIKKLARRLGLASPKTT
jgi:hypothetical protein